MRYVVIGLFIALCLFIAYPSLIKVGESAKKYFTKALKKNGR